MSGRLEAQHFGDLSNPPAPRVQADLRIIQTCGDGAATAEGVSEISRLPYVQDVTTHSARILLTTTGNRAPKIVVSMPDGGIVATLDFVPDPNATMGTDAQWVSSVEGLQPNTLYCYELAGLTERTGFATAPLANTDAPVRFVAFGDSGTGGADQRAVFEQIMTVPFDIVVHTGDVAYGEGKLSQIESKHFGVYHDMLAKFPSFLALGNHDYEADDGAAFRQVFALPENGAPDGLERWYSFDWGDVHLVALDTQRTGAEQAAWLDADLSANELPWTIVYGHKPPYSNGTHGSNEAVRKYFVPVLERHRVPLMLSGHEHNYERFRPIDGVTYVVTGGGGNLVRPVGQSANTAFSESVLHFVYVEIQGNRLSLHAIDGSGTEFDSAVIER